MFTTLKFQKFRWDIAALSAILLTGIIAMLCIGDDSSPPQQTTVAPKQTASQKAEQHLSNAHLKSKAALDRRIMAVRAVFTRGRKRAGAFAEDALSWGGKWALVKGMLGIGEDDAHSRYLAESFGNRVFSNDALQTALEGAVKGYVSDLDAIENQMLVQLRADLADSELGRGGKLPVLSSDAAFREEYQRLAGSVTETLKRDAGMEVGRQVAGFVVMDAATPVVISIVEFVGAELGVEAGILGTGAASGVATLGVGLIVGIIADKLIAWVLKEAGYDPEAEIAAKVRESLDNVESLMIDGKAQKGGLRRELQRIGNARSKCQDEVIRKLLKEGGAL